VHENITAAGNHSYHLRMVIGVGTLTSV